MQCHGSTTLSATREFASVASAIAAFAASTAAFVPRTLNSPGGAGCPPGKAERRFVVPSASRSASIAAPVCWRILLISSPPLPMSSGIRSARTSIVAVASASYCSTEGGR